MAEPTPIRPPDEGRQFLLGLGLGAIPLVIWLIFIGAATADIAGGHTCCGYAGLSQLLNGLITFAILWLTQVVVTIVMLARKAQRIVGYGLLVMLLIGPIVGSIACLTIPNTARSTAASMYLRTGEHTHAQISIPAE